MSQLDANKSNAGDRFSANAVESSTLELLNSEVDFLQRELEQRDQMIAELQRIPAAEPSPGDSVVDRMRDLLYELQSADARISGLEHELRVLEELRVAESEEKRQIESWVGEIESRIAKREEEKEVEIQMLRSKLEGESKARVETQKRADESLGQGGDVRLMQELSHAREENEELRDKHEKAVKLCLQMEAKLNVLRDTASDTAIETRIEDALREERLKLAQERALVSRREHEITRKLTELQHQFDKEKGRTNEADERFRVFRERLRELHEEEAAEYRPPSVGERLINMWKSLDGPTDVD